MTRRRRSESRGAFTERTVERLRGLKREENITTSVFSSASLAREGVWIEIGEHDIPPIARGHASLWSIFGAPKDMLAAFVPSGPVTLLLIACDSYETTSYVLTWATPYLAAGAIVLLDQFYDYPDFEDDGMRALYESELNIEWFAAGAHSAAGKVVST